MKKIIAYAILVPIFLSGCSSQGSELDSKPKTATVVKEEKPDPFIPLGWYVSLDEEELIKNKEIGSNFVITYVLSGRLKLEQLSDYLDEAHRQGQKVLMDITIDWKWFDDDMPIPSDPVGNWMWSLEHAYSKRASHHGGWENSTNEHGFVLGSTGYPVLNVQEYDQIEQWVYIPKNSTVKQLGIEFNAAKLNGQFSWNHKVYWGEDLIEKDSYDNDFNAFRAGDLPKERDQWVKLTFNANDINLNATVVRGVNFLNYGTQAYWDLMTRRTGKERIQERVKYLKDKPALYGWYLCDEPELRNISPERLKEVHDIIREADPDKNHIIAPVFQDWKVIEKYSPASDVIILDCYPVMVKSRSMEWMTNWVVQGANIARKQKKPYIFVPQGFGDAPEYPIWTMPNEAELEYMTWLPIILGARGICYWAMYKSNKKLISHSKLIFDKIKQYEKYLLEGVPISGVSCSVISDNDNDGNPDIIFTVLEYNGKRLLVAANTTPKTFDEVKFVGASFSHSTAMKPYQVEIIEKEF